MCDIEVLGLFSGLHTLSFHLAHPSDIGWVPKNVEILTLVVEIEKSDCCGSYVCSCCSLVEKIMQEIGKFLCKL